MKVKDKSESLPEVPVTAVSTVRMPTIDSASYIQQVMAGRAVVRQIQSVAPVKNLTPPLIAMVHRNDLLCEVLGDLSTIQLPVKGRSESMQDAVVIDVRDLETGEQALLICNIMMVSAFERAAKAGALKGRTFAIRAGDMMADKAYRIIDVIEVNITFQETPTV